ncbi:hypothetical protein [Rubinisphaera italica]|uniref:Integrase catalytic domain-containing protein n=1 Tax=Rubinisphaera italica TaxID=2527969 RepID=A0A5C5XFH1_9PLAN|nr:hypothetical protein [Rubinisphaera italica]TWT60622.1 hypothetical protein Pan54_13360 [Rubinisphaera italica]
MDVQANQEVNRGDQDPHPQSSHAIQKKFRENVEEAGMNTNPLPIASPSLNGRYERFIETIKLECLNKFIMFVKKASRFTSCLR